MARQIRYIKSEIKRDKVEIPESDDVPKAPTIKEILEIEATLVKTENELLETTQNSSDLKKNYLELIELKNVLQKTKSFFSEEEVNSGPSGEDIQQTHGGLEYVAGVIDRERVAGFERMLWRISRGNVFLRQVEIEDILEDPQTGNELNKIVFVAFSQGEQLLAKVKKVCTGYHATLYSSPSCPEERANMVKGVSTRLEDLKIILNKSEDYRQSLLVSLSKEVTNWTITVKKMKAIYHTLNQFNMDVSNKCLIGECWVPILDLPKVKQSLVDASALSESNVPSFLNVIEAKEQPPTFFRTNKFTEGFQNLISSYGIASYRECNPALYTIITFPFLFAIMFGDLGHGFIMTLVAALMVIWEKPLGITSKKLNSEIFTIFFGGRYIILLMGLFSMYTGIIYNDVFSKSMNFFGSSWSINFNETVIMRDNLLDLDPKDDMGNSVYPVGLDPVWQLGTNKIIFLNSYKMRLSIIFGVVHMIFGVCMSTINLTYFKKRINIVLEFLPQILLMVLLFAYMAFLMFLKWVLYSAKNEDLAYQPGCAPSILIMFINMMLFKGTEPLEGCSEFMFKGQNEIQMVFVFISLICIPWMLLGKPLYVMHQRKKQLQRSGEVNEGMIMNPESEETVKAESTSPAVFSNDHEDEPISEIFIHQAIHTIEYVLNTISHTASYLRLWALSLAHARKFFFYYLKFPRFYIFLLLQNCLKFYGISYLRQWH